jgi:hypothetical protein
MSNELTLDQTMVVAYQANIKLQPQMEKSVLVDCVNSELNVAQAGKMFTADSMGKSRPTERTGRAPKSPEGFVTEARRVGVYAAEHDGKFIDEQDKLNKLVDPTTGVMQAMLAGKEVSRDLRIMQTFFTPVRSGETGEFSTVFPAARLIGVQENTFFRGRADGVATPSAVNLPLTPAKLRRAKALLGKGLVRGTKYIAVSEDDIANMLTSIETTSRDYVKVEALVAGDIDVFCGFKFKILPDDYFDVPSAGQRRLPAWIDNAITYKSTDIEEATLVKRTDRAMTPYAYYAFRHGGLREFDEGVVGIDVLQ